MSSERLQASVRHPEGPTTDDEVGRAGPCRSSARSGPARPSGLTGPSGKAVAPFCRSGSRPADVLPRRPLSLCLCLLALTASTACAQQPAIGRLGKDLGGPESGELAGTLRLVIGLAVLAIIPSLLMTVTAFTRIIIVLSFLRGAMGTQTIPPSTVLAGLALFLTFFVMYPTWNQIDAQAIKPYSAGKITYQQAIERGGKPLREFMLRQTRDRDLLVFVNMAGVEGRPPKEKLPFTVIAPAFLCSELRTAFEIGLVLYIPFLVIDLVVASALMSMGMMMVPPVMISLPLKVLLFVMADGWSLLVKSVVLSFT